MNTSAELAYSLLRIADERFGCDPASLAPTQHDEALRIAQRRLAIEKAVLSAPEAAGVIVPDNAVAEALDRIKARYADEEAFLRALNNAGIEPETLRASLLCELRVDAVMERVSAPLTEISDTEANLYYYMNPGQFERPELRTARHILVTINPDFPENQRDNALKKIQSIQRRLDKKPDRFEEQAFKHSECPTALQGGTLGKVKHGQLFPALDTALFAMQEGRCSEVIESPLGFHVLYCETIHPSGIAPLNEVLPGLRQWLHNRQKRIQQRKWLESILIEKENNASVEHLS